MIADDGEKFVSRWSRLKKAARAEEKPAEPGPAAAPAATLAAAAPAANPPAAAATPSGAETPLPPVESLKGLASDYTDFLKPGVDENLKRSALKKLFSDPHFEAFERFEAYCEDYTKGEPIPAAMLRTLEHAKGLLFDEEKKDTPKDTPVAVDKPAAESLPEPAGETEPQIQAEVPPVSPDERPSKA